MKKFLFLFLLILLIPTQLQAQVIVENVAASLGNTPTFIGTVSANSFCLDAANKDVCLERDAANTLAQRRTTNGQIFRVYGTFTDASNYERVALSVSTSSVTFQTEAAGTGTVRGFEIGTNATTAGIVFKVGAAKWQIGNNTQSFSLLASNDNASDIGMSGALRPRFLYLAAPAITQGSATGLTINDSGSVRDLVYKVNAATTAFVCAATTCDLTIGTLPANTQLVEVFLQIATTFACTATCTSSTLSFVLGKGAGGAEYLASLDADAATGIFGDADAELGTLMTRAAAIQGGTFTTTSQVVVLRLVSGTGNIGNGAVTNLSQGSVNVWLTTRTLQ